ncbi:MAG: hypothetical protein CMB99_10790 [Flavobacteriaceae bacterium]|nr:hypothetical protein [Flavobacteriaceae bacterium]|tara:strand:- start:170312 stop:171577 length:1266 start_codon:yes stop_codon:yes gene_type:complete
MELPKNMDFIKSYLKNINKTVLQNYIYLLLIQIANFVLPLIALPYLVITLNTEGYGLVMIAQSLAVFLGILVDFGFNISATREVSILRDNKEALSRYFSNVYAIKIGLIVLAFLFLAILIAFVPKFQSDPEVYFLSFGIVIGQAIFPTWFFQGIEKMRIITIINVVAKAFFTISIFFFILSPEDYLMAPILNSLGMIISGALGLFYCFRFVRFTKPNFGEMKAMVVESSSLMVSNFAVNLYTYANTLILGLMWGDSLAGIYASMEKLVLAIKSVYAPLYQAIFPFLAAKKKPQIVGIIKQLSIPISIFGVFATAVLLGSASVFLDFIYGNQEISSYSSIFRILSFIAIFSALNMLLVTLYLPSIKEYKLRMKILSFAGLLHLMLVVSMSHFYDIYGVAITASFTELLILLIAYFYFKKTIE